jgi:hypothetical protein
MIKIPFDSDFIADILHAVNTSPHAVNGLRIDSGRCYQRGDRVPDSMDWPKDSRHPTNRKENGVSTYPISTPASAHTIGFILENLDYWWQRDQLVLVGGQSSEPGKDSGEVLIHHGRCVDMWYWPRLAFQPRPYLKECHTAEGLSWTGRTDFQLAWHEPFGVRDQFHSDRDWPFNPWVTGRDLISEIVVAANASPDPCKGLRVDYARQYRIGETIQDSIYRFVTRPDSTAFEVVTDRPQAGVCTIGLVGRITNASVKKVLEYLDRAWSRDGLILCGGSSWRPGSDPGEKVISKAKCLGMWRWPEASVLPVLPRAPKIEQHRWKLSNHYPFGRRAECAYPVPASTSQALAS